MTSPKFSLNWEDLYKVARGALIIALGAFCLELLTQAQAILDGQIDLGPFEFARALLTSTLASLIELARRYFRGPSA